MNEPRVGDIAPRLREPDWIASGSLVIEAIDRLGRQLDQGRTGLLLVVHSQKDRREILGAVTLKAILAKLEPPALAGEEELPIFWQGQLTEQARELFNQEVVDSVMVEPGPVLNSSSTLMEALHLMNSRQAKMLVVVNGGQVVGLLTRRRLYKEIVRAARS